MEILIPPALAEHMDRLLITPDDVLQTIAYCEETGVKLLDDNTGDLIGHRRIGALTYWVRYRIDDAVYTLLSVYTHRAVLLERPPDAPKQVNPAPLICLKCDKHLAEHKVMFQYLDFPISAPLPSCFACGQAYLSEEFVCGRLSEVEKTLEDK